MVFTPIEKTVQIPSPETVDPYEYDIPYVQYHTDTGDHQPIRQPIETIHSDIWKI